MGDYADDLLGFHMHMGGVRGKPRFRKRGGHCETCKCCGMRGLKWRETESGWRLFEKNRDENNAKIMHNCRAKIASPDDFDEVTE